MQSLNALSFYGFFARIQGQHWHQRLNPLRVTKTDATKEEVYRYAARLAQSIPSLECVYVNESIEGLLEGLLYVDGT